MIRHVVMLKFKKDADPNQTNKNGDFPFVLAAQRGHSETAKALLEGGAKPNGFSQKSSDSNRSQRLFL